MTSLNIGCGEHKIEGFINIDCIESDKVEPDLVLDIITQKLPYEESTVDEIWMIHSLEHIELIKWEFILLEFVRVLKPNGLLVLAYPEFEKCAQRYLQNTGNMKNFWRMCLYGRQLYRSDYHVVPMQSSEIKQILEAAGFYRVQWTEESEVAPYNTILNAYKNPEHTTRESVLIKELHLEISDSLIIGDKL